MGLIGSKNASRRRDGSRKRKSLTASLGALVKLTGCAVVNTLREGALHMHKYDVDGELQPVLDLPRVIVLGVTLIYWYLFGYFMKANHPVTESFGTVGFFVAVGFIAILLFGLVVDDHLWRRG